MLSLRKYARLALLLFGAALLAACVRDDVLDEIPAPEEEIPQFDGYSLNLMVSLDRMGASGTRAISDNDPTTVTYGENYINLERFRILFFDSDDKFLFESKNRWLKQIDANTKFTSWFVEVPLGPFGNDTYDNMDYDWTAIHDYLTNHPFKVAILANRPAQLLYPGNFMDSELSLPNGVFDNDGPYWGPDEVGKHSIFDLHHYQYDIIYADKGQHNQGASAAYYDFIMGNINTDRPTMGSAVNWVSFKDEDYVKDGALSMRPVQMPSEEHPIPMYGIQEFDPIPEELWKEGTPFDLSNKPADAFPDVKYNYNTVSLLRSCVRLDLLIPKSVKSGTKPKYVMLWYSNIYSRTEPMDTWTPTDLIWKEDHDKDCEWLSILEYGPFCSNTSPGNGQTKALFQQRMSWYYGAWREKGWEFKTLSGTSPTLVNAGEKTPYPRIFNSCIQRNKVITCQTAYVDYGDNYHHWVVYTGERNSNDANSLPDMVKNPYIACFIVSWGDGKYYCIPLLNYAQNSDSDRNPVFGPHTDDVVGSNNWPAAMNTYMNSLPSERGNNLPYPLLRNHIYRFTLTNTKAGGDDDELSGVGITSEVMQTADINFAKQIRELPAERLPRKRVKRAAAQ